MGKRKSFAGRLRELRTRLGLSARALSLNAGLSPAYVNNVELGRWVPRREAVEKLAGALSLSPRDWTELRRLAGIGDAPTEPVPDLVLWSHLAPALYAVRHELHLGGHETPEDAAPAAVSAAAALLTWTHLSRGTPDYGALRERVIEKIAGAATGNQHRQPTPKQPPPDPVSAIIMAIPPACKQIIFGDAGATEALARQLRHWTYSPPIGRDNPGSASFVFATKRVDRALGVRAIPPRDVRILHDIMIVHHCWARLDLESEYPDCRPLWRVEPAAILDCLLYVCKTSPDVFLRLATRKHSRGPESIDRFDWLRCLHAIRMTRFALRAFQEPSVAALFSTQLARPTGRPRAELGREHLEGLCADLECTLKETHGRIRSPGKPAGLDDPNTYWPEYPTVADRRAWQAMGLEAIDRAQAAAERALTAQADPDPG